jgi:MoaA/NifB/PqqE/SkfB family radical SAM enzyme
MSVDDLRAADESLRNFSGKAVKSACYAPFVSLYLNTTGAVQACCRNQTFILGNINDQRLTEIWNGGKIDALRKALTDYNFNHGCTYCEWESKRRSDSFSIRLMSDPYPVVSPQPEWPSVIEFNGSNTCNLECIQCCGESSSSIRGNLEGLPPLPKVYKDQFFEDLRLFLPHLRFINFLGGEPFLAAEVHRIWDMMIEDGLTIPCRVTTNGTQYNARIERALNAIPMHITVSVDGITKETFEKIRRRANFETVIANLHRFHAYTHERGMNFGISYCLMRQNWHELGDIVLFAEQLDCELSILMVAGPSQVSLFTLPPHELRGVVGEIEKRGDAIAPQLKRHRKAWEETVQHLKDATKTNQLRKIQTVISSDELLADTPIARARKLAGEGDYEKALRELQGVRQGQVDYYYALALSGYVRSRQGDMEGAGNDLEKALQVSRKLPDAHLHLARVRLQQGRLDAALEYALQARERVVPEERIEAQVLLLLGLIYACQGRMLPAYRVYSRLARLPQPSREGMALPDSLDGARRSLSEIETGDGRFRARSLLFRVYALFRLAAACHRVLAFTRTVGGVSQASKQAPPGDVQSLLPAEAKRRARWTLRVAGVNNKARLVFPAGDCESVRIDIAEAASGISHDIQLNYTHMEFSSKKSYQLKFRVRADRPRTVGFGIAKATAPWSNLGLYRNLELDTAWREVQEKFVSAVDEENGRIHFDLGESGAPFEVASLVVTGPGRN